MSYINKFKACTRCKSKDTIQTIYEVGETVCTNCGLVYEERVIVDEDEKRTFADDNGDNQIHRVGPPVKPTYGNELGSDLIIRENGKTKVIKSHSKYSKISRNFSRIQNLLSNAGISSNMIELTKELYEKVLKNKNMQGRNVNNYIIATYYFACRENKMAQSIENICKLFGKYGKKDINEVKKSINKIKKDIVSNKIDEKEMNYIKENYIQTFIGGDIQRYNLRLLANTIIDNVNKSCLLKGRNPKTIAGLSLFISCKLLNDNLYENKEFYSKFCNKNILKNAFTKIKDCLDCIIPKEYCDKMHLLQDNKLF